MAYAISKLKFQIPKATILEWAKARLGDEDLDEDYEQLLEALCVAITVTTDAFINLSIEQLRDLGVNLEVAKANNTEPGLFDDFDPADDKPEGLRPV